jgi:hypothetical protein
MDRIFSCDCMEYEIFGKRSFLGKRRGGPNINTWIGGRRKKTRFFVHFDVYFEEFGKLA